MSPRRIAAIDIGGTKLKACLFVDGKPIVTREADTEAKQGGDHVLRRAGDLLAEMAPFERLGVSTAGQVDPENGTIRYANENIPGYTGKDVRGILSARFGVPVAVVNDVYAAALGEYTYGGGRGEDDLLCITYGTGIGGSLILGGKPYYGRGPSAGVMLGGIITHPEKLHRDDPFAGSYERHASATALVARARALDPRLIGGREIFARMDEPEVQAVVDAWLGEVAAGLCSLIYTYNVPCVLLGGGVMEQPYAADGARERVLAQLIPGFRGVEIKSAQLGNMAGLYGALTLAQGL
ncbi:MAG: ROK family protein [Pseudoflavonifractor sp.]